MISIIMPSLNQADYIRLAIDSVLTQECSTDIELIVVDGGSTDRSLPILRSYGQSIRWLSEPDNGQSDAVNKGLRLANGEIIGWLNSDDIYRQGAFESLLDVFKREPSTLWAYGKGAFIDSNGFEVRKAVAWYKNLRCGRFSKRRLLTENWIWQQSVFWRRGFGEQIGPLRHDLSLTMDYDLWLRMADVSPGRFVNQSIAAFRLHRDCKSQRHHKRQLNEAFQVARQHCESSWCMPLVLNRIRAKRTALAYWLLSLSVESNCHPFRRS